MYQPNTKAWLFDYSSEYFHVLCPATTFSLISLFVLDTPAYISTAFTANIGKSPNDRLLASSTGIAPLRGSPGAALIGCGVFTLDGIYARPVTGREYHCPCCLLLPCQ